VLILVFVLFIDLLFSVNEHQIYSLNSVVIMTLGSAILFLLSFSKNIVLKFICLISVIFITHRFAITYIYPTNLDYHKFVNFSKSDIEEALLIYLYSLFALVLAFFASKIKLIKKDSRGIKFVKSSYEVNNSINTLGVRSDFNIQVKWILYIAIFFAFIKVYFFFSHNFGVIGNFYSEDLTYLMRFVTLSDILYFPIIFFYLYINKESLPNKKFVVFSLIVVIFISIIMTSRALILVFILNAFLSCLILNIKIPRKYYIISALFLLLAVFVLFPLMTSLREVFIVGDLSKLKILSNSYSELVLKISARVGTGYDSWFLWFVQFKNVPFEQGTFSILNDFFRLINSFFIGDLVHVPDKGDLGKIQLNIGRGNNPSNQLGGNSESPGPISVAWIYFQNYHFIYWFVLYYFLLKIQDYNLHPFWVFFIICTYAYGPSGNIVMQSSTFTFLVIFLLIGVCVNALRAIKRFINYS